VLAVAISGLVILPLTVAVTVTVTATPTVSSPLGGEDGNSE